MAENVDCSKSSEQIVAKYRKTPPCGGVLIFLQRIDFNQCGSFTPVGRFLRSIKRPNSGLRSVTIANTVKAKVIGRSHRKLISPSVMINARRKFSSIKPPKIKPSRRGASGKFARRRAIAPSRPESSHTHPLY